MTTVERKQIQKSIKNTKEIFTELKEFIDFPKTTTDIELKLSSEFEQSKAIITYLEIKKQDDIKIQKFTDDLIDLNIEVDCKKIEQVSKLIEWANLWMYQNVEIKIRYKLIRNTNHWYVFMKYINDENKKDVDTKIMLYENAKMEQ